jgi:hypothetical protein
VSSDIQIFGNEACTELPSGNPATVYARINVPWSGMNSGWEVGSVLGDQGSSIQAFGPDEDNSIYAIGLWIDWWSDDSETPYSPGQVVELVYGAGSDVPAVDGFTFTFSKP